MSTLFSNFFQTFFKNFKKVLQPHKSGLNLFFIFWPTRSTLSYSFTLCLVYNGLFSIIISSTLLPKNSPPDCFLNGRLQIPSVSKQTEKGHPVGCPFLAHPKGFEPPFSRIGICCVIQLRHGWIFSRIFIRLFIFN